MIQLLHNASCIMILYNAITGAIRNASKEKPYQELSFEYIQQRRWFRKCFHFKYNFLFNSFRHFLKLLNSKIYKYI